MSLRIINRKKVEKNAFYSTFNEKQESRQWLLVSLLAFIMLLIFSISAKAQLVVSNPGEYTILAEGNNKINDTVRSETKAAIKTGALQNAMSYEFSKMKKWEQQYNKYLKSASGYASALKAATHIYDDGMRILFTLNKLRKATSNNPQGVVATLSMNNLYMETLTEFISVGNLLKSAIARGGKDNMLTGSERSKTLWALEDRLSNLSHRLQLLYYSIRHYKMVDVWNRVTAGMIQRDKGSLAEQSLDHWKRHAKEVAIYSR